VRSQKKPLFYGLARRLRQARREKGYGFAELAERTGLSTSIASHIERDGRIPNIATIEKIAEALAVSPGWLAFGSKSEPLGAGVGRHEAVALRLRALRAQLALSRRALGARAQLSGTAVALIEDGRTVPRVDTVEQLAHALRVAPAWLAFGEGEGPLLLHHRQREAEPRRGDSEP
jgi:transcriptional regulator with XRE-family HTH domain